MNCFYHSGMMLYFVNGITIFQISNFQSPLSSPLSSLPTSGTTPFFVIGLFCTPQSICLNISFWQGSFVWKFYVFNRTFKLKNGALVFWKVFLFLGNLFQSESIENIQNFQWLSHKKMPIFQTRGYLKRNFCSFCWL